MVECLECGRDAMRHPLTGLQGKRCAIHVLKALDVLFAEASMSNIGMTVQFSGEDDWDAVINHFGFNIIEEDEFEQFIVSKDYSKESQLEILEMLVKEWFDKHT